MELMDKKKRSRKRSRSRSRSGKKIKTRSRISVSSSSRSPKKDKKSCGLTQRHYNKITKLLRRRKSTNNKNLCTAIEDMIPKECLGNMKVVKYLGGGHYGKVLSLCKDNNNGQCKAIKIILANPDTDYVSPDKEISNQKYASTQRLAPKIHRMCRQDTARFILMDKVDGVFEMLLRNKKHDWELDVVFDEIKLLLKRLCKTNITHGDLHWGNVGYMIKTDDDTKKSYADIILIDFGHSYIGKCNTRLDLIQLIRTSNHDMTPVSHPYNLDYLYKKLFKLYVKKYNNSLREKDIEKEFKRLFKIHEKILDNQ
jgi:hypothetical protein